MSAGIVCKSEKIFGAAQTRTLDRNLQVKIQQVKRFDFIFESFELGAEVVIVSSVLERVHKFPQVCNLQTNPFTGGIAF